MYKKLIVAVMSLMLMVTCVAPVFAEGEEAQNVPAQQTELQGENVQEEPAVQEEPKQEEPQKEEDHQEPEKQEEPEDTTPTVESYNASSPEFQVLHIEWTAKNTDKVRISIAADESMKGARSFNFTNETSYDYEIPNGSKWKKSYVKIVPYKSTTTGKPVETSIDIFDPYKPKTVEVKNNVFKYEDGIQMPDITVTDKSGNTIPATYLKRSSVSSNYPGKSTMDIRYTGMYSGLPNFKVDITILPPVPYKLGIWHVEKTKLKYDCSLPMQYYYNWAKYSDYVVFQWSKYSDFRDAKTKKIYKKTSSNKKVLTKLKKNTKYYLRAKSVKVEGGKKLCSEWVYAEGSTVGDAPSLSASNPTTKKIIKNMRKNKSFKITLPNLLSISDAYHYACDIRNKRPHLDKFTVDCVAVKDNRSAVSAIKFKYNKKKAKTAVPLNKKLMKIVRGAKKKKGARAKVKYVNDQICKTCSYHYAAYRAHQKGKLPAKYSECYSAYGCLVQHKAVCAGYTDAFAAIMTELGIKNGYGHAPNHIWNKVKIGKKWYHVDVTWNDCTHSSKYLLKNSHPKK